VEEERRRIAREIHDILGQGLIGLRLDTSWLSEGLLPSQGELAERTADMVRNIDDTIRTVKRIAGELRPPLLDDLGLGAAIEWQAKEFQKRSGIPCRVSPREIEVCPEGSTALFRIFQEALSNVVQHARATLVRVRLLKKEGDVVLTVRDNGVGINAEKVGDSRSLGLLGMRERAYLLGGTVALRGTENRGSVVTVRIPLRPPGRPVVTGAVGTEDP
jgi:signal transduction histidine kinase